MVSNPKTCEDCRGLFHSRTGQDKLCRPCREDRIRRETREELIDNRGLGIYSEHIGNRPPKRKKRP